MIMGNLSNGDATNQPKTNTKVTPDAMQKIPLIHESISGQWSNLIKSPGR
jgi:hypothetical protein